MLDFAEQIGATRGSALYYSEAGSLRPGLEECFRFVAERRAAAEQVQQGRLEGDRCVFRWRPVRPIPEGEDFFETVWRGFRENRNIG